MNLTDCAEHINKYITTHKNCTQRVYRVWNYISATRQYNTYEAESAKALEFIFDLMPTEAKLLQETLRRYDGPYREENECT
jgi:hypothetical protein